MSRRRIVGLTSWLASATASVLVLASTTLPVPPRDPTIVFAWAAEVGPIAAALGVVRIAALSAAVVTCVATVLGLAARALRWARLAGTCDRLTLPAVRRFVDGVTAGSLAAVVAVAPVTAGAAEASPPTPALRSLDTPPPMLRRVEPAPAPQQAPASEPSPVPPAVHPPAEPDVIVVQPGDSFWRIAERIMSAERGRPATDAEVAPYWRRLVHANLDRLAVAGEPDLIFAGQEFRLPG